VTENPGRQHTSSFQPIENTRPRVWWGSSHKRFYVLLPPDVACTMMLLRRRHAGFRSLSKDLFRLLMETIIIAWHRPVLDAFGGLTALILPAQ